MNASNTPSPARAQSAMRSITEFPEHAAKAVELMSMRSANFALTREEAASIVSLMRLVHYPAGATLFQAGDESNTGYMLLLLEGDVSVDTGTSGGVGKVDISVIGPGALMGELALLDGSPRSATCTAASAVVAAGLSTGGLQRLAEQFPKVAVKLVVYIAQSASDRLRSLSEQLQMYDQITASMQSEINQLRAGLKK
jgi:CRP/FNR family cyclic AMP-dependent transcriptional regulator